MLSDLARQYWLYAAGGYTALALGHGEMCKGQERKGGKVAVHQISGKQRAF